jgi:hypothetical protein
MWEAEKMGVVVPLPGLDVHRSGDWWGGLGVARPMRSRGRKPLRWKEDCTGAGGGTEAWGFVLLRHRSKDTLRGCSPEFVGESVETREGEVAMTRSEKALAAGEGGADPGEDTVQYSSSSSRSTASWRPSAETWQPDPEEKLPPRAALLLGDP